MGGSFCLLGEAIPSRPRAPKFSCISARLAVQWGQVDAIGTIVLPGTDMVTQGCGTNDSHFELIKEQWDVPLFVRGAEVFVTRALSVWRRSA